MPSSSSSSSSSSWCRVCCPGVSSVLCVLSVVLLAVCLFSASFRNNQDSHGGTKNYGLFRFCYTPKERSRSAEDDSNTKTCHLRNYINSQNCQGADNGLHTFSTSTRDCYGDFELSTIILIIISIGCSILAVLFSICSFFAPLKYLGALAHSILLLIAAICTSSGFLAYTYYGELKENQFEVINGYEYQIHFGWAYYVLGGSALLQWISFVCSLFGSAFILVHKNKRRGQATEATTTSF